MEKTKNPKRVCPTITVIVPVFNAEKYLAEAIQSVLSQSYQDWELILINDCSPDSSKEICQKYAASDPRIIVIDLPENKGVSVARNIGLDRASGDYLIFLDADDMYLQDAFTILMTLAEEHPFAGMICGDILKAPKLDQLQASLKVKEAQNIEDEAYLLTGSEALESMLYQRGKPDHSLSGKLFKTSLFRGIRFVPGTKFEDMEIFPRLLRETKEVILTPLPVYFYRQNPTSFLNSPSPARLDAMNISDKILEDVSRYDPKHISGAKNLRLSAYFTSYFIASILDDREKADRAWSVIRQERREAITDKNVRLKNKVGVLLSYLGRPLMTAIGTHRKKYR